jgi:hypothetical protein
LVQQTISLKPLSMTPWPGSALSWLSYQLVRGHRRSVVFQRFKFYLFPFVVRQLEISGIRTAREPARKKTDAAKHPKAFHHVGLLVNEPPGPAGLLFT